MAQDEPGKDISYTRPIIGVPSALDGLNSTNNTHHNQDCEVSTTFPGGYVVTISGGIDILAAPPMKGFLLQIDARGSVKDIIVAPTTGVVPPGTPLATVLAGTYSLCVSDGVGWAAIPDTGTFGASATFPSALARGQVDANVPNLAAFAVAGAGRDGITYAQGDIVVLNKQTTVAENGPYVVGAVAGGNAPLTRPGWWATGSSFPSGFEIQLSNEGTVYGGLKLLATKTTSGVVDTDNPILLFQKIGFKLNSGAAVFTFQKGFTSPPTHNGAGDWIIGSAPAGVDFTKMTTAFQVDSGSAQVTFEIAARTASSIRIISNAVAVATDLDFDGTFTLIP